MTEYRRPGRPKTGLRYPERVVTYVDGQALTQIEQLALDSQITIAEYVRGLIVVDLAQKQVKNTPPPAASNGQGVVCGAD
jgi:hypothetical protein